MSSTADVQIPGWTAGTWTIDPVHSHVGFVIKHMMVSKVRGHFETFSGTITTGESLADSGVDVTIEAASINTNNSMRDEHVRTADFFDAASYRHLTFVSTGVRVESGEILVYGDLTIRGITRPITLVVETPEFGPGPVDGAMKAGFSATAEIERGDFGVSYNGPIPGGGMALGDKVQIVLDIEADLVAAPTDGESGENVNDPIITAAASPAAAIPSSHQDLVTSSTVALSTINSDGSIQTTAVWVLLDDDGLLRTSLAKNRMKYDNLIARPTATVFSIAADNPFHTLEVRAQVEIQDDDPERTFMAKIVGTYGQTLETMADQAAEDRVVVTFHPVRVRAQG
ncbi:hypothetical protein BH09ACT12_BH09ACT12_12970 [soil metagenome]